VTDLEDFAELVQLDHGLCVVSTLRPDGTIQSSVVNAGVLDDPRSGASAVGFVVRGGTRKIRHLRDDPRVTVVVRAGWRWVAVEGRADLIGPDDPDPRVDGELPALLRDIFTAAGGTHDDWDTYDQVMAAERRAAVLIAPDRVYSNPPPPGE
jgi:PPOX class probable F420-dependent enzyme